MTVVIGLHGPKGSGKDYFYKVVSDKYPKRDIRKIAYADPIKHKVMFLFGLKSEDEYDQFKRTNLYYRVSDRDIVHDGRHIVREIGMMMRDYDKSQFIEYVESTIKASPNSIWCITDVRFNNEAKSIQKIGGTIVKIHRTGFEFDGHVTETEFKDSLCDYQIYNTSTIEQYEQAVINTFDEILTLNQS